MTTSPLLRLFGVFFAPFQLFKRIKQQPNWLLAFFLSVIITYGFSGVLIRTVGIRQLARQAADTSHRLQSAETDTPATSDEVDEQAEHLKWGLAAAPITIILGALAVTVALWMSLHLFLGSKVSFGNMFAVTLSAGLISSVKMIAAAIVLLVGMAPENFNLSNPVGTNPAFFLASTTDPRLRGLLSSVDLVAFWYLSVLILGCSVVANVSRRGAATIVLSWWSLVILVKVAFISVVG